jgi:2',3'-cyclic-nucleotide 2'-phosphodiesterase (5'-nucleotidase family)
VEGGKAYVALQENNALAIVDIATATVDDIIGLGYKDHSLPGNGIDANNDRSTPILIDNRLPIKGMYQPDAITSIKVGDVTYLLTANEGDGRDYDTYSDETEIGEVELDPASFSNIARIEELANGLTITSVADTTADGKFKEIIAYGSRSFTIWNAATGAVVWDSKDDFEQITAALYPKNFNASNSNNTFKNRSDNKGPEPEAITVGTIGNSTYAFIGLERIGGVMVYDITDPTSPSFVEYVNNRDFSKDVDAPGHGDSGPEGLVFVPASESPNNTALLIVSNEVSSTVTTYAVGQPQPAPDAFTLELLHVADQEAAGPAIQDAPRFSAVMNALDAQDLGNDGIEDNTIRLSSGDVFLPGLFRDASIDLFGAGGVADMQIQNELGFQAIAFGNHEFDFGTQLVAELVSGQKDGEPLATFDLNSLSNFNTLFPDGIDPLDGTDLDGLDYTGTDFPYLSTNLDFSTDENMAPLAIDGGLSPVGGKVTSSTIINVNGENIGVVGATTPTLRSIASPGDIGILPSQFNGDPSSAELDSLATVIQLEVDTILAANTDINKVILLAHMQDVNIEFELAKRLKNVDIIVAAGSNTRLFDSNDRPRPGDSNQGMYPTFFADANGDSVAVVNTDAQYKYVGRLVIDFDEAGKIIPASYDAVISGAYPTDSLGVAELDAEDFVDPEIQALATAIEATIISKESVVLGRANVFLNGNRSGTGTGTDPDGVRTQETNLGNLTADANLAAAKAVDNTVTVSIKNGGGIRASIGRTIVQPGGTGAAERLPNEELIDSDGNVVKPIGGISQNDITTTLAFNNGLTLLTLTKSELVAILEHAVSDVGEGRFGQFSGVKFSFDPSLDAGARVKNAVVVNENGETVETLVSDGAIAGDANATFRIVTLNFLADGGDDYPFPSGASTNRVDLFDLDGNGTDDGATGDATFANDGTEQDALAEYLLANFNTESTAFDGADVGPALDERIQNLAFREDGISGVLLDPDLPTFVDNLDVNVVGTFQVPGDVFDESAAEIPAYDMIRGQVFFTDANSEVVHVLDMKDPANPTLTTSIELQGAPNSVAIYGNIVAVATEADPKQDPGLVEFFDASTYASLGSVTVGALPDMVTFSEDGTKVLTANEGEPSDDYTVDPEGSISVVTLNTSDLSASTVETADFTAFNDNAPDGVRIFGPGATVAQDLEPEYITVSGNTAYVTCQENNALAIVDINSATVTALLPLGSVDHSVVGNGIDASNRDEAIQIAQWPVNGFYMPDAIASYTVGGNTYLVTANEGDAREYIYEDADGNEIDAFVEEDRIADVTLDPDAFPNADFLQADENLGRLKLTLVNGDTDGDGDYDELYSFGTRSFTIWNAATGAVVWDSKNALEQLTKQRIPDNFNATNDENNFDNRSDDKGPEPEGVTIGEVDGKTYAFVGLERVGGIVTYDISDPSAPVFANYINNRDFSQSDPTLAKDLGPEGLAFVPAEKSPTSTALLIVTNEVSGTVTTYSVGEAIENSAPIVVAPITDQSQDEGFASTTIDLSGVFNDPNGDALTFTATSGDANVVSVAISGNTLTITETGLGTATVGVTASDGSLSTTNEFTFTVNNVAPVVASPISDVTLDEETVETVDVSGTFTDAGSITLTVNSSSVAVASVTVSGTTLTISGLTPGTSTVTVTATDNGGLETSTSFTVTVEEVLGINDDLTAGLTVYPNPVVNTVDSKNFFNRYCKAC